MQGSSLRWPAPNGSRVRSYGQHLGARRRDRAALAVAAAQREPCCKAVQQSPSGDVHTRRPRYARCNTARGSPPRSNRVSGGRLARCVTPQSRAAAVARRTASRAPAGDCGARPDSPLRRDARARRGHRPGAPRGGRGTRRSGRHPARARGRCRSGVLRHAGRRRDCGVRERDATAAPNPIHLDSLRSAPARHRRRAAGAVAASAVQ